jgi:4-amino-4-deoxy-L-arabinose transferase-like glycosyltransferase
VSSLGSKAAGPIVLGVLIATSVVASLVLGRSLFPLYSINHDDAMYVYEARLLGDGDLTLSADEHDFLRPWASGVRDDRVVMKYTPPWPALLAASQGLTGSMQVASATIAAVAVGLLYLLAREVVASRRVALIAAGVFALSPVTLIQSGTALPYLFQLVTGLAFAVALLAGLRRESAGLLAASGAAFGVGFFARPFDALLFALPFGVAVVWKLRGQGRALARVGGCLAGGALPILTLAMIYNAHTMGSPLALPFTVTSRYDTLGFGRRGIFADSTSDFSPLDGVRGLTENLQWFPTWSFGGWITFALAGFAVVVLVRSGWRHRPWLVALAGSAVAVCLGYVVFWSPFSMAVVWPGAELLGPYYHLAVLVPLAILGALGVDRLYQGSRHQRRVALAAVVAGVTVTGLGLPGKIEANAEVTADYVAIRDQVDALGLTDAVLIVPARGTEGFQSPAPFLENRPDLDQPVLYAEDREEENLALFDRYADRGIHQLVQQHEAGDDLLEPSLVPIRLRLERGDELTLELTVTNPSDRAHAIAYIGDGRRRERQVLDDDSQWGDKYSVTWTLAADDTREGSVAEERTFVPRVTDAGVLTVGFAAENAATILGDHRWERRFPYRIVDGEVQIIRPGRSYELLVDRGDRYWIPRNIDDVVAEVDGSTPDEPAVPVATGPDPTPRDPS